MTPRMEEWELQLSMWNEQNSFQHMSFLRYFAVWLPKLSDKGISTRKFLSRKMVDKCNSSYSDHAENKCISFKKATYVN